MHTTLHRQTNHRLIQRRTCTSSVRAERWVRSALTDTAELILRHAPYPVLSLHPHPKAYLRSRLAAVRRWAGDWSYRVATNRYVFYGSFILLASLIAGAVSRGHEVMWRSAAALGIATAVIGLLHAWLDAGSARKMSRSQRTRRARKPLHLKSVNP